MARRALVLSIVAVTVLAVACAGDGSPEAASTAATADATQAAVSTALEALCRMERETDVDPARATFFDRVHTTLHATAERAAELEPGSDADLLIAKERVEADLEEPALPPTFAEDVRALRDATAAAAEAVGLTAPACGS